MTRPDPLDQLLEADQQLKGWQTRRAQLLTDTRAFGYTLQNIADALGLTRAGVLHQCRKAEGRPRKSQAKR